MIRAMAESGLRRGEVIGLRWEDVDLVGLRLHVRRSVSDVRRGAPGAHHQGQALAPGRDL